MKIFFNPNNIIKKLVVRGLISSGYSCYSANLIYKNWYIDILKNKKTPIRHKLWAYKRGFLSEAITYYGLKEENYKDYLSDLDYYRLHPINGAYSQWIDDKLTIKYILRPFSNFLPEYYYHIYGNEILKLADCPDSYGETCQDVINLLNEKRCLVAKLVSGTSGEGFYKIGYSDRDYFINNRLSSELEICGLIKQWLKKRYEYLVTEYIIEHENLRKIWNKSPSTIRIMVIRERNELPKIVAAYIRFGTEKSGVINNQVSGSVTCMIDIQTGQFSDGSISINYNFNRVESNRHPDSNELLKGEIPHWAFILQNIMDVSNYLPQVRYMGFDLIVTKDGFKIIEINSFQGVEFIQYYHPLLKDESSKEFFINLLKEKRSRI